MKDNIISYKVVKFMVAVFLLSILVLTFIVWRAADVRKDEHISAVVVPSETVTKDVDNIIFDYVEITHPRAGKVNTTKEVIESDDILEATNDLLKPSGIDVIDDEVIQSLAKEEVDTAVEAIRNETANETQESTVLVDSNDIEIIREQSAEVTDQDNKILSENEEIELKAEDGYTCLVTLMPEHDGVIVVELDDETKWAIPEAMVRPFISSTNLTDDQKIDAILTYPSLMAVTPEFEAMSEQEQMEYMELIDPPEFTNHMPSSLTREIELHAPVVVDDDL